MYFKEFSDILLKYTIESRDIYNIDKTGFRIRVIAKRVVITYLLTKAVYLVDPNNRELITIVKIVYTNSSTILLILILKGDILLKKYFENDLKNDTLLITSPTRYSNEGLSMKYFIHFYNNIYKKIKGK